MEINEFFKEKELLLHDLQYTIMDIELHIRVAKFINGLTNPYYWYILQKETLKGRQYKFFRILAQTFLDNADSDRDSYVLLILLNCPEELKEEVIDSIYDASSIPFIYARYLTK